MTPRGLGSIVVIALLAPALRAHEMGQLETTIRLDARGAYQIEMPVDPDALLTKLEVFSQEPLSGVLPRDERDRRIIRLGRTFLDRVQITFDGIPAKPVFHYQSNDGPDTTGAEPALVRLTGRAPAEATSLVFSDELTMGTYGLRVVVGERTSSLTYLSNGEQSQPIPLPRESREPSSASTVNTRAWAMTLAAVLGLLLSGWLRIRGIGRSKLLRPAYAADHRHPRD